MTGSRTLLCYRVAASSLEESCARELVATGESQWRARSFSSVLLAWGAGILPERLTAREHCKQSSGRKKSISPCMAR